MTVSVMVVAHFLIWNSQGRSKTSFRPDLVKLRQNDVIAWLNEDFFYTAHWPQARTKEWQRDGTKREREVTNNILQKKIIGKTGDKSHIAKSKGGLRLSRAAHHA